MPLGFRRDPLSPAYDPALEARLAQSAMTAAIAEDARRAAQAPGGTAISVAPSVAAVEVLRQRQEDAENKRRLSEDPQRKLLGFMSTLPRLGGPGVELPLGSRDPIEFDTRTALPADVLSRPPVRDIVSGASGENLPFNMMENQPVAPITVDTTRGLSGADWLAARKASAPTRRTYLTTADAANAEDYARIRALQADLDARYGTDAEIAARSFEPRRARAETAGLEEAASLAELSAQRARPSTTPGLSIGEELAVTTDPRRFQSAAVQSILTGLARLSAVAELARQSGSKEAIAAADAALARAEETAKLQLTGVTGRNLGFYGGALGGLSLAVPAPGGDGSQ